MNELCSCKLDRELNRKVRSLFIEEVDKMGKKVFKKKWEGRLVVGYNCDRYKNKLKNGYNVVWKSCKLRGEGDWMGVVWKNVVKRIGDGWEFKRFREGEVGMKKVFLG